jgi:hypothetical protein
MAKVESPLRAHCSVVRGTPARTRSTGAARADGAPLTALACALSKRASAGQAGPAGAKRIRGSR